MTSTLYSSSINIDPTTGVPQDYLSLVAAYEPLIRKAAFRAGVPTQHIDDAVQEVLSKFFAKGGLDFYDPNKKTKFATMYYSWCSMFMLQERDRYRKSNYRNWPVLDLMPETIEDDFSELVDSEQATDQWVSVAEQVLIDNGREDLIPVLKQCIDKANCSNKPLTYAEVSRNLGISMGKATKMLKAMRSTLSLSGMGADSFVGD